VLLSFEVLLIRDLGSRFAQRRNFLIELEEMLPEFYEHVGQHLKAWQPPPPKLKDERFSPEAVTPASIHGEAEAEALAREGWADSEEDKQPHRHEPDPEDGKAAGDLMEPINVTSPTGR
jgi:hypothetical protein